MSNAWAAWYVSNRAAMSSVSESASWNGNALVLGERRAERLTLLRPRARLVEKAFRRPTAPGGDEEPLDEDPLLRARIATGRDAIRVRHPAVSEHDLGMVVDVGVVKEAGRPDDLEPGRARLDDEKRLLAVCDGEDDVEARIAFARHEPLLAVQDPVVAVANGGRLQASEIGPAPGSVSAHASL